MDILPLETQRHWQSNATVSLYASMQRLSITSVNDECYEVGGCQQNNVAPSSQVEDGSVIHLPNHLRS
ncbi:unnamed protein product [Lasius platythorax]|uniref:Uncharacterized protein n=1 Tax=Lasius platythorax TaxID=488582 RepID=A0AAV2NGE4_9HYME